MRRDVLIAGAGPTGLVLALWLTRLGVRVRIIDKTTGPSTTSRALAVQARTLELYRQLDLADVVVAQGFQVPASNLWVEGEAKVHTLFGPIGAGLTPYPYVLVFPQDQHERLLIERLQSLGVSVERQTELISFKEETDHVTAQLQTPGGHMESCEATYLAGCDGARSIVRSGITTGFPGGTYSQLFYVADVAASGPTVNGELHIALDEADFLAVFPLAGKGRVRLVGTVRDERASHPDTLKFEDVSDRAIKHLRLDVTAVHWFSTYLVHHRVADHFRRGRAFLLGDAAHIHSPAGGQGMNTGIGDAINLAWKLATVLEGRAPSTLLDSYEAERIGFARRLVATTDAVFSFATAEGCFADILRARVAPLVLPLVTRLRFMRRFLFQAVSQTTLNYRGASLSQGHAGQVRGGDRLPWVPGREEDNFASLSSMTWQVHVYGRAGEGLRQWCAIHGLPLSTFPWRPAHQAAGLVRDALYLLRPDTYVALADASGLPGALERYFAKQQIRVELPAARA